MHFTLFILLFAVPSNAGWLLYHKPAFKGKLIDSETSQPIEGVAVVVAYNKRIYGPVGSGTERFDVKEGVTDNNGIFRIPSYTTIISPFTSGGECVNFLFYKAGYSDGYWPANFTSYVSVGCDEDEFFFTKNFGKEGMLSLDTEPGILSKFQKDGGRRPHKVVFGVAKLHKIKTIEDRWKALTDVDPEFRPKTPILQKLLSEERIFLGIGVTKKRERVIRVVPMPPQEPPSGRGITIQNDNK